MRLRLLAIGALLSTAGFNQVLLNAGNGYFTAAAGVLNIVLAFITAKSAGVSIRHEASGGALLVVDKGVVGTSIYQLAFFDGKLVMKKLASFRITIILALVLAVMGFIAETAPIGVLSGGLTGYSMQEYFTQKNRDRIVKPNLTTPTSKSDLEIQYSELDKAHIRGSSLYLFLEKGAVRVSLPRGYAAKIRTELETILDDKYEESPSPNSANP